MAEALSYVRVVFAGKSTNIDLDGKIRTNSDIAENAATKHLGMTLLEAEVPTSALSLRGPVFAASKAEALHFLVALTDEAELSDLIAVSSGAWFLLTIHVLVRATPPPGEF